MRQVDPKSWRQHDRTGACSREYFFYYSLSAIDQVQVPSNANKNIFI